ncbi:MAG: phosphoribosylanthranilate isomerase [Clostridia bacterium]|nr:phosphoribosylanthranilate isomerase [Clostridia bacterium]
MAKIKICGLSRDVDAEFVNAAKPDFVGFIIGVPFSKRNIDINRAERMRSLIDEKIPTVGVFINYPIKDIAQLVNRGIINIVQLHGSEDEEYIKSLRKLIPHTEIWKAFVVKSADDISNAEKSSADRVLLDSGTGCGKTFDWSAVSEINREFILAGGLNSENIPNAISQVNPWAVDLSSGVETGGVKDREKILKAVKAAK